MKVVFRLPDQIMPLGQVKVHHVAHIAYPIRKDRVVKRPLIIAQECGTVPEDCHRYAALRKLGTGHAPCVEVDDDIVDDVEVTARRENELATSQDVRRAASKGAMLPPKTSKHMLKSPILPIPAPLGEFLSDDGRSTDQIDHRDQKESS